MAANLRIRLGIKIAVGPFHPSGKADVFLSVEPTRDGKARVDITRINFPGNAILSAAGRFYKDRLTDKINDLIVEALKEIPLHMPQVEEVTILEIAANDSPQE